MVPPDMTNEEFKGVRLTLARAFMTQENRDVGPRINDLENTLATMLRDFLRMNPPTFLRSKVGDDPQAFLDDVYKIVHAIWVTSREKEELVSYQLKGVSQVWYT